VSVDVPITHGRQEVVQLVVLERGGNVIQLHLIQAEPLKLLLQHLPTAGDVLVPLLASEPLPDLVSSVRALDEVEVGVEPVPARPP
jgi:hypothetical protein